jgi:curved DNA-binding protein
MRGEDIQQKIALFLEEAYHGCEKQLRLTLPVVDQQGLVSHQSKTLNVKIPAGMQSGQFLRLKGQGAPGIGGGANGDLIIEIELAPHPRYHVEGKNLFMQLPVAPWEAVLGSSVQIDTLAGTFNLKIPENSHTGTKLKLKGKGLAGKPPGDLLVQLVITIPKQHSPQEKELYQQLQALSEFDPRAEG